MCILAREPQVSLHRCLSYQLAVQCLPFSPPRTRLRSPVGAAMSDRVSSVLRSLVSWYKTRKVSPTPLSASPKDSALESIQDSESVQLLGAKVSLLDPPPYYFYIFPYPTLSSPLPRMLQQEETPYTVPAMNSNQTPPIQRLKTNSSWPACWPSFS